MTAPAVRRADFLMALAYATDLATGQSRDFALRSCVLAMRLAEVAGLDNHERRNVYHQALLRYIGCNADTHLLASAFGDEIALRRRRMSSWEKTIFGDGRTPRMGFWFGLVGVYLLLLLTFLPFNLLGAEFSCANSFGKALVAVCLLIPGFLLLRISGRRLHDLGWPGWAAFVLPALMFIEGDTTQGGIRYYCDIGILSPIQDVLSRSDPLKRLFDAFSPWFTPFGFTLNGMEVDLVWIGLPVLLYLGLYPGMRGENRYGVDPRDKPQAAAADTPPQEP